MSPRPIFNLKKSPAEKRRQLLLRSGGVLLVVLVAFISLLPVIIKHKATGWFIQHGADHATIDNVDFNPFTGRLEINNLRVDNDDHVGLRIASLTANIEWWPVFSKHIYIEQLSIRQSEIQLKRYEDGTFTLGGFHITSNASQTGRFKRVDDAASIFGTWAIGVNSVNVDDTILQVTTPQMEGRLEIPRFQIAHAISWKPELQTRITTQLQVDEQAIELELSGRLFKETADINASIKTAALELNRYEEFFKLIGIQSVAGKLSAGAQVEATLQSRQSVQATVVTDFELTAVQAKFEELSVANDFLRYQSKDVWQYPAAPGEAMMQSEGTLALRQTMLTQGERQTSQRSLDWNGRVEWQAQSEEEISSTFKAQGTLNMEQVRMVDQKENVQLLAAREWVISGIDARIPHQVHVAEMMLSDIEVLQELDAVNHNADLPGSSVMLADTTSAVNIQLDWENKHIRVQNLAVDSLNVTARRQADGRWYAFNSFLPQPIETTIPGDDSQQSDEVGSAYDNTLLTDAQMPVAMLDDFEESADVPTELEEQNGRAVLPFTFAIEQFTINSESSVRLIDESVEPVFQASLTDIDLSVSQLDSINPDNKLNLNLHALLNGNNQVTANGWMTPFHEQRDAQFEARIDAVELVPFTSYSESSAGYKIKSGRMNALLNVNMQQNIVNADAKLTAKRLTVNALEDSSGGETVDALGMPLDTAISLMKDRKGTIIIEIPLSGDLNDPAFAFGSSIRAAATDAIRNTSISYLADSLQPYGTIRVGVNGVERDATLALEPIHFEPGQSRLDKNSKKYMDKIAGLMRQRPAVKITLCGTAAPADKKVLRKSPEAVQVGLDDALRQLAQQRGDLVRNYLSKEKKISRKRINPCDPVVAKDKKAQPKVSLAL